MVRDCAVWGMGPGGVGRGVLGGCLWERVLLEESLEVCEGEGCGCVWEVEEDG